MQLVAEVSAFFWEDESWVRFGLRSKSCNLLPKSLLFSGKMNHGFDLVYGVNHATCCRSLCFTNPFSNKNISTSK